MVEVDVAAPILLGMAILAAGVEIFPMRAGPTVAGIAVGSQFLGSCIGGMADMAPELGVNSHQRKFCLRKMVVVGGMPDFVVVAIIALGAEAPGVRIIGFVA